jgi:hypothetical protein
LPVAEKNEMSERRHDESGDAGEKERGSAIISDIAIA